jgi:hypothetical protein
MKYKTAFRLTLRAIGVFVIARFFPELASVVVSLVQYSTLGSMQGVHDTYYVIYGPQWVGSVVGVLIGLYLLLGGKWLADTIIPSNHEYCFECGYDLTGSRQSDRCPECGVILQNRLLDKPSTGANKGI